MSMIHVERLTKYFGPVEALRNVSFEVDRGEVVGFLGPNGAGKSTTMRILTTWLPATSGIARVAGFDVMNESMEVRRNIGYLPESVPLYPEMRVEEYLAYRAKLKGMPRVGRSARIDYCLERCRLKEVRRRLLGTLSKGYRQRVGLADAMIHEPAILILDEPTSGLDPLQIRETLALIKELGESHTVLLSTHILSEVEAICERVIIITHGRVAFSRTLEEIESRAVVHVEVHGPREEVLRAMTEVHGVLQLVDRTEQDGLVGLEVTSERDEDMRDAIGRLLTRNGWPVRRLERKRRKLEDAFFEVMRSEDPVLAAAGTRSREAQSDEHVRPAPEHAVASQVETKPADANPNGTDQELKD